ncbi:MAG TPA: hypothetical protein DCG69_04840 [Bacteroidales bacterium]|nr:hypothetical protein [Bacteroidales bacterium]
MLSIRSFFVFYFFLFFTNLGISQSADDWWYEIHQTDGITPWQRYLILSPAFMGPNAFPVPAVQDGLVSANFELETSLEGHFNVHENTENIFTKVSIPLMKDKIVLEMSMVPVELFWYDTLIRDQRFSRNYEGKGIASGDVYVGTHIQLVENRAHWPDIMVDFTLKTSSGNQFESARFSKSNGYYLAISGGKSYFLADTKFIRSVRLYAMLGFYAWQTNLADHMQDDALLYGFGFRLNSSRFSWSNELAGFYGYLNNGDRPLVYRSQLQTIRDKKLNYALRFEHGTTDYDFRSIRISLIYSPRL